LVLPCSLGSRLAGVENVGENPSESMSVIELSGDVEEVTPDGRALRGT
jgi:hypothetical protein